MSATRLAAIVLAVIAVGPLLRLVLGLEVTMGAMVLPMWPSAVAFLLFAGLSALLWREARRP
ncbi:MAG: hypothetical protein ACE5HF_11450 [Gemmatimonadota bacterium]